MNFGLLELLPASANGMELGRPLASDASSRVEDIARRSHHDRVTASVEPSSGYRVPPAVSHSGRLEADGERKVRLR